jgi:hypothetical protein
MKRRVNPHGPVPSERTSFTMSTPASIAASITSGQLVSTDTGSTRAGRSAASGRPRDTPAGSKVIPRRPEAA